MKVYDPVEELRKRQADQDLLQRDMAELIGVSQQYLSDVLKGRREPGPRILEWLGLCKAYVSKTDGAII